MKIFKKFMQNRHIISMEIDWNISELFSACVCVENYENFNLFLWE